MANADALLGARPHSAQPAETTTAWRPDVQGLRAVAVLAVMGYHLWPGAVPGGFVGVDVFFVISGYLITGQLARAAGQEQRARLLQFWGRRARRLLPAAAVVLSASWAVSLAVLPGAELPDMAAQVRASAGYVQNWLLARQSVNYLQSTDPPSPVEHFWSLSVEEQFYLAWPLLFLIGWLLARRFRKHRQQLNITRALIAGLLIASLWYSIVASAASPAAYFVTTTRAWELALGGLIAVLPAGLSSRLRGRWWLAATGVALLVLALFVINGTSAYPGSIALLPTAGAAALLLCGGGPRPGLVERLLSTRPMVVTGGLSYALYLWHFPIIVLWEVYLPVTAISGVGLMAVAFGLSWLTKRYVEDPIRRAPVIAAHTGRSLAAVAVLAVPVTLVAVTMPSASLPAAHLDAAHPGAAVLAGTVAAPAHAKVEPAPSVAPEDAAGFQACEVSGDDSGIVHCRLGDTTNPRLTIALVGDSVVGQWQSALAAIATRERWQLITVYKASCDWSATMTVELGTTTPYTSCHTWGVNALHDILDLIHPNVVITSGRDKYGTPGDPRPDARSFAAIAHGTVTYWRRLLAAGIAVVPIAETPEMGQDMPDCLTGPHGSVASCSVPRSRAVSTDSPIDRAAATLGGAVHLIDMNSLICRPTVCAPVVGNVMVYVDQHHLTRAYTVTMEPYLQAKLLQVAALDGPGRDSTVAAPRR